MDSQRFVFKRVKERSIQEARESVFRWRQLFQNGEVDGQGNRIKYSLKQAAEKVGVPKKTLEDYHQLLRKAGQFWDLENMRDEKMGYLRTLLKNRQHQQQQQQLQPPDHSDLDDEDYHYNLAGQGCPMQEEIDFIVKGDLVAQYNQMDFDSFNNEVVMSVRILFQPLETLATKKLRDVLDEEDSFDDAVDTDDEPQ